MDTLLKYFPDLDRTQLEQFSKLADLYTEWNAQINVISRQDIDSLYLKHVLHSLAIAKVHQFSSDSKILDVGTGGGFPGIPLAILFPACGFHLVDSIGKKIHVVKEVAKAIGLENVTTAHERAERVSGKFDFVVSRAVTQMKPFVGWVHNKFAARKINSIDNGILYLKGGDLDEELDEVRRLYRVFAISDFFIEPFFETKKVVYLPMQ